MKYCSILLTSLVLLLAVNLDAGVISLNQIFNGPTPFISYVSLKSTEAKQLKSAQFVIQPKDGSETRPITVMYSLHYLESHGYVHKAAKRIIIPVFGLYQGRSNSVTITLNFPSGGKQIIPVTIVTPSYIEGTYSSPTVVQQRVSGTTLSYDFIML